MTSALPHDPIGWFAVAFSGDLRAGQIETRVVCEHDIVVFRTAEGRAAALDAHCPHMGAHLGGGRVEGEALRCPFHGFTFSTEGDCTSTPYDGKVPPTCRTRSWPVHEVNGFVLVWHHPDRAPPTFEVPPVSGEGWLPLQTHLWPRLRAHPQETSENTVDLGHFNEVHGYHSTEMVAAPDVEGAHLTVRYRFTRAGFGLSPSSVSRVGFEGHAFGLGVTRVDVREEQRALDVRLWILCTPTRDGHADLRIAMTIRVLEAPGRTFPLLALLPRRLATRLVQLIAFREFKGDVHDDFEVWTTKVYLPRPALAKGDGPIGIYRRWCRQFYADTPTA